MAKFFGQIGYVITEETSPGVYTEKVVEKDYYGDVERNVKNSQNGEQIHDNIVLNSKFSIVADAFAYQNFLFIKYIKWMGSYWKVTSVEPLRPRLILTVGGLYNGKTNSTT